MNPRRLYRSRDRQLVGVAGGMAEYLDVDPTIVRILWILAALFSGGLMILGYIILAFVIPETPLTATPNQGWSAPAGPGASAWGQAGAASPAWSPDWAARAQAEERSRNRSRGRGPGAAVVVGTLLIVFGVIALADAVLPGWVGAVVFGPALVIALGAALLVASVRRGDAAPEAGAPAGPSGFTPAAASAGGAGPAAAATFDAAPTTFDAEATASVNLGTPADPTESQPGTDLR